MRRMSNRFSALRCRSVAFEVLEDRRVLDAGAMTSVSAWFERLDARSGPGEDASSWIVQLTEQAAALAGGPSGVEPFLKNDSIDLNVIRGLGLPGMVLVEGPGGQSDSIEEMLARHPLVDAFQPDRVIGGNDLPNDPRLQDHSLPGLNNNGSIGLENADIDAPEAWDMFTTGDPSVIVGVIDSGVDLDHPDLYLNVWINQGEIPEAIANAVVDHDGRPDLITFRDLNHADNAVLVADVNANGYIDANDILSLDGPGGRPGPDDPIWINGEDDDGENGNGFEDDLFGWDFIGTGDNDPTDLHGHGTHVGGTIAAIGNNATGVVGVAWNSSIMPLRFLDANRAGQLSDAIAAICYATMMRSEFGVNMPVTNNSWGYRGSEDPLLRTALEAYTEADMLFVAAAGNGDALGFGIDNDADPEFAFYPASDDLANVVSVAATDTSDRLARFSNFGATSVDLAAPGVGILSTDIQGDGYFVRSGTSMAAPHVAGVAALIWAANPEATALEVRKALLDPLAVDRPANLAARVATGGRLNAFNSLDSDTIAPRATAIDLPNVNGPDVTEITFTVEFTDNRSVVGGTIDEDEIRVVDTFDGTELTNLELIDGPFENAASVTAMYRLTVPGGFEDGDFEVFVRAGSVIDAKGNPIADTSIGKFNADTTDNLLRASELSDRNDPASPLDSLSLRKAIVLANADDQVIHTIRLTSGTYELDIAGTDEDAAETGDLDISSHVIIKGAGADRTVIDANGIDRVLHVLGGATLELRDLSVIGGDASDGGGIKIDLGGSMTLLRSMVSNNMAEFGGGISNAGSLNVYQSTIHNNTSILAGGGVFNDSLADAYFENSTISSNSSADGGGISNAGIVTLRNATIAENTAAVSGGGIQNVLDGTVNAVNTIIADNVAGNGADFSGEVTSPGFNLIGDTLGSAGWVVDDIQNVDPLLGPLQVNGGNVETVPVWTHALLEGSPAIDAGKDAEAPSVDQRGIGRPQDANNEIATADIGAVELFFSELVVNLFRDLNNNGHRDLNDAPLSRREVFLDGNHNQIRDPIEFTTITDNNGVARFSGLQPSRYSVAQVLIPGWTATSAVFGDTTQELTIAKSRTAPLPDTTDVPELPSNPFSYPAHISVSDDGRFVAFSSIVSNYVPGDTNFFSDVFLLDRFEGTIQRLSENANGSQGNGDSRFPTISANGRFVAFESEADNLVAGDTDFGRSDVFIYDTEDDALVCICDSNGANSPSVISSRPSISGDGRHIVFEYGSTVYIYDQETNFANPLISGVGGADPNSSSGNPVISRDGQHVVFASFASNLVEGDTNGTTDVFIIDRDAGFVERIEAPNGDGLNGASYLPTISSDGRFIAFTSSATNLGFSGPQGNVNAFLIDRNNDTITLISRTANGEMANGDSPLAVVSNDGTTVVVQSLAPDIAQEDNNGSSDLFHYDIPSDVVSRLELSQFGQEPNGSSAIPSLNGNGRIIAFRSDADNLTIDDDNSGVDTFLANLTTSTIVRIEAERRVQADGNSGDPSVNADGRYVAFESQASNLDAEGADFATESRVVLVDRVRDTARRILGPNLGLPDARDPAISGDGRLVVFSAFGSFEHEIFAFDIASNEIVRQISPDPDPFSFYRGSSFSPDVSSDGNVVAYATFSRDSADDTSIGGDIYVADLEHETLWRVSVPSDGVESGLDSLSPALSGTGRYLAFESMAPNLVPDDPNGIASDVFLADLIEGSISLISEGLPGIPGTGFSTSPAINYDGRFVAFESSANYLVPNDVNGWPDVFTFDRLNGVISRVSENAAGLGGNGASGSPSISDDGRFIAFTSDADNLVDGDTNSARDVFIFDRETDRIVRSNLSPDGSQGNLGVDTSQFFEQNVPEISGNGLYVSYSSFDTNIGFDWGNGDFGFADVFSSINTSLNIGITRSVDVGVGEAISVEFGSRPLQGQIRGKVFQDLNGNGESESDEIGITAWNLFLDTNNNFVWDDREDFAETDAFGDYLFSDLDPLENYSVVAVPEQFWVQTTPRASDGGTHTVYLDAGQLIADLDFGFHYRGPDAQSLDELTGTIFQDTNRNGVQDDGEDPLVGRSVYIDENDNNQHDLGEREATTDGSGAYRFSGLPSGLISGTRDFHSYLVRVVEEAEEVQTLPINNLLPGEIFQGGVFDRTRGLATGDFDGDTFDDLVVTTNNNISILLNDRMGGFPSQASLQTGVDAAGPITIDTEDFNDDGKLDLVVANSGSNNVGVMLGNGDGTFADPQLYDVEAFGKPRALAIAHFDADEYLDIAVGTESRLTATGEVVPGAILLMKGMADGLFHPPQLIHRRSGVNAFDIEPVDLDGGPLDLVIANFAELQPVESELHPRRVSLEVTALYNRPNGFVADDDFESGEWPAAITQGDFDGDGDRDIAVANFLSDNVTILKNGGLGFLRFDQNFPAGTGPYAIESVDVDGDRDLDLVVANADDSRLAVLKNGSTIDEIHFLPPASYGTAVLSGIASAMVTADFDKNELPDFAISFNDSTNASIAETGRVETFLNSTFAGGYEVTLDGRTPAPSLDFGFASANTSQLIDRKIFHNNTSWDGYDPAANSDDDAAIATNKTPLFAGEMASAVNYTSSVKGINGVMIDIAGASDPNLIGEDDFVVRVGTTDNTASWTTLTVPPLVSARAGSGSNASDRITLTWPDGTITNTWLEIRVLANADTGLAADEVFYFGNRIGDVNGDGLTNAIDFAAVRSNPANFLSPAAIDNLYDLNRDGRVNAADLLIVRDHATGIDDMLPMITPSGAIGKLAIPPESKQQRTTPNVRNTDSAGPEPVQSDDDTAHLAALLGVMNERKEVEGLSSVVEGEEELLVDLIVE